MASVWSRALCLAAVLIVPVQAFLEQCGNAFYDPAEYTCYGPNDNLCPITNGEPTLICGLACFSTRMYSCRHGVLQLNQRASGAFTLTADNPTAAFHGMTIEASGEAFYIGQGPSTYCPVPPVPAAACPPGVQTILYSGALAVEVPGGQQTYIQTTGALSFTMAHSSQEYNFLSGDTPAYHTPAYDGAVGGGYYGPNGVSWNACPVVNKTSVWQVFANMPSIAFVADCVGFYAAVHDADGALGAWQYV